MNNCCEECGTELSDYEMHEFLDLCQVCHFELECINQEETE